MYQRSGLYLFRRKTAVRLCHALDVLVLFCKEPKEGLRVWEEAKKKEKDDEVAACHSVL